MVTKVNIVDALADNQKRLKEYKSRLLAADSIVQKRDLRQKIASLEGVIKEQKEYINEKLNKINT